MIQPTTKNSDQIMQTLLTLGFAPWKYPSQIAWQEVADAYNAAFPDDQLNSESIRARYRRIMAWLDDNDYEPEDYVKELVQDGLESIGLNFNEVNYRDSLPPIKTIVAEAEDELVSMGLDAETPEQLLAAAGLDPLFYEVGGGKVAHWGSGSNKQWSISTTFKRREVPDTQVLDYIAEAFNKIEAPPYNLQTPDNTTGQGVLCVMSLYDVHLEKVEVVGSVGLKIRDYHRAVLELAGRVQNVAQFVLPFGNDFGNFDNVFGTTTKGTPQENGMTWQAAIDMRAKLLVWTVETLSEIAPVHVIFVGGNHDQMTNYLLGKALELRYEEDVYITVDNGHNSRKYYLWNQIGLMFTHGSDEKLAELPMIFATEGGEVFAPAAHREIHTGDKHGRVLSEKYGILTRILPSLSGADNWHQGKGFVQNKRAAVALTYTPDNLDSELLCYV